jgi:division protein CdvB (Snf7/Vps24/ESCRT-III family)
LETELTKLLGSYSKSSYQVMKLIEKIDFAISQAQELDLQGNETWHENRIGTRLHILVGNITRHTAK